MGKKVVCILLLSSCAEPVTGLIAVVDDDETGAPQVMLDAAEVERDAATDLSDARMQHPSADGSTGCLAFPDAFNVIVPANGSPGLTVSYLYQNTCATVDRQLNFVSSIYSLQSGEPLVQQGKTYSFHWTSSSLVKTVELYGGTTDCPADALVRRSIGQQDPTCVEFISPTSATHLLIPESNATRTPGLPHHFRLCAGSCAPP